MYDYCSVFLLWVCCWCFIFWFVVCFNLHYTTFTETLAVCLCMANVSVVSGCDRNIHSVCCTQSPVKHTRILYSSYYNVDDSLKSRVSFLCVRVFHSGKIQLIQSKKKTLKLDKQNKKTRVTQKIAATLVCNKNNEFKLNVH